MRCRSLIKITYPAKARWLSLDVCFVIVIARNNTVFLCLLSLLEVTEDTDEGLP